MKKDLKGQVAFVTGASSGIGEATAAALAQEGVKVAAIARRKDRLESLAKQFKGQVLPIEADISDENQVIEAVDQTVSKWGGIDILIANAGVMMLSPVLDSNTDEWRDMVNINVLGLMYCAHRCLPVMTKKQKGHIVTISSVAGRTIFPNGAVYCATKYAVRAFSEALRQEVCKDNIRVTTVEPGAVNTELHENTSNPHAKEFLNEFIHSFKALESEDIATAIIYALQQPDHVDVNEILIRPTAQVI